MEGFWLQFGAKSCQASASSDKRWGSPKNSQFCETPAPEHGRGLARLVEKVARAWALILRSSLEARDGGEIEDQRDPVWRSGFLQSGSAAFARTLSTVCECSVACQRR